jgi:hypothetical protein
MTSTSSSSGDSSKQAVRDCVHLASISSGALIDHPVVAAGGWIYKKKTDR